MQRTLIAAGFSAVVMSGCAQDEYPEGHVSSSLDLTEFEMQVLPVLLRDCGFQECHGAEGRPFQVWGAGRNRLDPLEEPLDRTTSAERLRSLAIARGQIDPYAPEKSPLLLKPLAAEAGGATHGGQDLYGRDVYQSRNAEGYKTIARWVLSNND